MASMRFVKMHGLGNDYVFIDCRDQDVSAPAELARAMSDRHTGIGADGLILMKPSHCAEVAMEMYNADGSRAQMCGNGIRCVVKYAVEQGLSCGPDLRVETDAGIRTAQYTCHEDGTVFVRVDMGRPMLDPAALPCTIPGERVVEYPLEVAGRVYHITCVSMGNPHAVCFVDRLESSSEPRGSARADAGRCSEPRGSARADSGTAATSSPAEHQQTQTGTPLNDFPLAVIGPQIERAPEFPDGVNFHMVQVESADRLAMRPWERGSGLTRACGTGACAVCVAGVLTGRSGRLVTVRLPGGELQIEWADDDHVHLTGPAVEVFSGTWPG